MVTGEGEEGRRTETRVEVSRVLEGLFFSSLLRGFLYAVEVVGWC